MMTPETDFKEKPKRRTRQMPLDFIVPVQLEECIYRLQYAKKYRRQHEITVTLQSPLSGDESLMDEQKFLIQLTEKQQFIAEAILLTRRWEGTSTRFEGTLSYIADRPAVSPPLFLMLPLLGLFIIGGMGLQQHDPRLDAIIASGIMVLLPLTALVIIGWTILEVYSRTRYQRKIIQRFQNVLAVITETENASHG